MRHEEKMIGPEWAKRVLEAAPPNVRKIIPQRVDQFARDMLAGRWRLHHQGIAFDENGEFFDGFNRLNAVVKSGCTVPMKITYGVPCDGKMEVDGQTPRSLGSAIGTTAREAAIARVIDQYPERACRVFSRHELAMKVQKYHDGISFAVTHCKGLRVSLAVLAARGFYHYPNRERLALFFEILRNRTGKIEDLADDESAAGEYRKKLRAFTGTGGADADLKLYCFGQTALIAFMEATPLGKFCQTQNDQFPLPS